VGGGAKIPPTLFFFKGQNSIEVPYKKLGTTKTKTYILKERPKIKTKVPMRRVMNAREEPRGRKGVRVDEARDMVKVEPLLWRSLIIFNCRLSSGMQSLELSAFE
jgi:hypothetical protein